MTQSFAISNARRALLLLAVVFLAGASAPRASGAGWRCSPDSLCRELTSDQAVQITRVDSIPLPVLRALGFVDARQLASPGEPWNQGCVQDAKSPGAMLVFAARTPHAWFACTLHGGFVVTQQLVLQCETGGRVERYQIQRPVSAQSARRYPTRNWPASLDDLRRELRPEWIVYDPRPLPLAR